MMDGNSGDQPARKLKIKEREPAKIRYDLLGLRIHHDSKAKCKLRMPANLAGLYGPPNNGDDIVVLDVKDPSDIHCVTMMRNCLHPNILHATVLMEKDPFLLVLVENYTGILSTYLRSIEPYIPMAGKISDPHMIPSPTLQHIVSQILEGLFTLWKYSKHHGNLKLGNTCYLKTSDGVIVPKLTSFKDSKGRKLISEYQVEDLKSVGDGLTEISEIAKEFNKQGYLLDCSQIDHLARRLKSVSQGDLHYTLEEIKTYPFFWTRVEAKFFLTSQVPFALDSDAVKASIEAEQDLCTIPWNKENYKGLLAVMIKYRQEKKLPAYDFKSRVSYVQFISGMYTHEFHIKLRHFDVHTIVKSCNPRLYVTLYSLIPRAPRPIDQD